MSTRRRRLVKSAFNIQQKKNHAREMKGVLVCVYMCVCVAGPPHTWHRKISREGGFNDGVIIGALVADNKMNIIGILNPQKRGTPTVQALPTSFKATPDQTLGCLRCIPVRFPQKCVAIIGRRCLSRSFAVGSQEERMKAHPRSLDQI